MKRVIVFVFTLFFFTYSALSQTNKMGADALSCIYSLTYRPDSLNSGIKTDIFRLIIHKNSSLFEGISSHKADSILKIPGFNQASLNAMIPFMKTDFKYQIFKFYDGNIIRFYDRIKPSSLYEINQRNIINTWKIEATTKSVAGFTCQKATTSFGGRNWVAWFTKEVPVSDGPYKFRGLPGLIVEVYDIKNDYHFTLVQLKNTDSPSLELPTGTPKAEEAAFKKAREEYFYQGVLMVTKNNSSSPADIQKGMEEYKQKQARKNNPIELR